MFRPLIVTGLAFAAMLAQPAAAQLSQIDSIFARSRNRSGTPFSAS